jgi:hypothetical protein
MMTTTSSAKWKVGLLPLFRIVFALLFPLLIVVYHLVFRRPTSGDIDDEAEAEKLKRIIDHSVSTTCLVVYSVSDDCFYSSDLFL